MRAVARVAVGTADGLREYDAEGRAGAVRFEGRNVTAVAPEGPELWAVLDGREVWHTAAIDWWFHVADLEGLRADCLADTRAGLLVGTSEARLFRVAGEGLEAVGGFDDAPGRDGWYTPWGGPPDTRSVSEDDETVYVNVHVGGILRSVDGGETWQPTIDPDWDVHRVLARPGRLYAACARGLAVSPDRGGAWSIQAEGLHARYCRGVAVCGETVLVSASEGPGGRRSALYRGSLDGGSFERCRAGLPEWFDANIDSSCLDAIPETGPAAFGTADGRVFVSPDEGASWGVVASGLPGINCVLVR
jgi:hypothetical protein